MRKLRVLDLFSGIGGFSLGLERAGMETVAFCEISEVCRHLLAHHWPKVPAYDDITTLTAERLVADGIAPDALCGGFPCQDLSYAGKGAGLDGARSGLWFEIARLLRELRDIGRPVRIVVLENVSALLGRGLGVVLGDLAALGYDAEWDCIPASAVGAPHRRDRIWIVAYPRGEQHEGFGDAFRRALAAELSETALSNSDRGLHAGGLVGGEDCGAAGGSEGRDGGEGQAPHGQRVRDEPRPSGSPLANAISDPRDEGRPGDAREGARGWDADRGVERPDLVANANGERREERHLAAVAGGQGQRDWSSHSGRGVWLSEPDVGRVAHGVPARVDCLHGLGNAVVPQIPEALGRAILAGLAHLEATPTKQDQGEAA